MKSAENFLPRGLRAIAAFVAIAAVLVLVLSYWGATMDAAGRASVIVASIGLVGVIFTASLTLIGLLLKDSIDRRAAILQHEAELRLKAETSLKAIELMTAKDLTPALAAERREGALIALSSLGYHTLILLLCERYWKEDAISPDLIMGVIDDCLKTNDQQLQRRASSLIEENAERLPLSPREYAFPPSLFLGWRTDFPSDVKHALADGLMMAMVSRPADYWESQVKNQFLYSVFTMFVTEDDKRFKTACALFAMRICEHLEGSGSAGFMPPDRFMITYAEIRVAALRALGFEDGSTYPEEAVLRDKLDQKITEATYALSGKISEWGASGETEPATS
ncbi:MAG TPA: hypothetical protein VF605_00480 [Allosphingosinicella sp.]